MHVHLSWVKGEEKLTSSLLVFGRSVTSWMYRAVCLKYLHTARTHMHTPQCMPPEVSSQSPSPEKTMGGSQYYIEPWLHGTLFHIR
jgi:hypothetical protein